jgi:hypothetical protein
LAFAFLSFTVRRTRLWNNNEGCIIAIHTFEVLALESFCSSFKYSLTDLFRPTWKQLRAFTLLTLVVLVSTTGLPSRSALSLIFPSQHVALSVFSKDPPAANS